MSDEMTPSPGEVPGDVRAALREVCARVDPDRRLLVALDFDGVLAPLVTDPAAARPLPASHRALTRLVRHPQVTLALVSGRALDVLAELADPPPGTVLIGSHGAQRGRVDPAGSPVLDALPLADAQRTLRSELLAALEVLAAEVPGAWVEHKPAAAVLHTRTVTDRDRAEQITANALLLGERPGVHAMRGKEVVELSVLRSTKGEALTALRAEPGLGPVLFAGDDVTDETVFTVLREDDVGIKVGPGPSAARLRVADPVAVAHLLEQLVEVLATDRD